MGESPRPGVSGFPDPEHADDWRPSAALGNLRLRAVMLARLRAYFARAGVLEVETPILSQAAVTDPALASFHLAAPQGASSSLRLYLQTSPEFPMKRLLAAGSGPIYQICKVFRDDERGRRHHPEFTLMEWYRPGWSHAQLMDEVAEVVRVALDRPEYPVEHLRYRDLFRSRLGLDPWTATPEECRNCACAADIGGADTLVLDRDGWLDLLLGCSLESGLGRGAMTFLYDYPESQAALSRLRCDEDGTCVAERFELYLEGVELANGFHELTDAAEQRSRFEQDLAVRRAQGMPLPPVDERFLAALAHGMPDTSGVALGLDRLLMRVADVDHIDEILAFPVERA